MHRRFVRGMGVVIFVVAACVLYAPAPAFADTDGGCGPQDVPYYNGSLTLSGGTYDVYVKLGRVGQTAKVSGYAQRGESGACQNIGSVYASGVTWRKLGSYHQSSSGADVTFQLSSVVLADVPNANRPSLMLVPQSNPICVPTTECVTTIAGQEAYIRPVGTNLESTALHIVRVSSADLSHVTRVEYYADSELLYQTKTLEEFKVDDIPYYASKLVRVLYYDSGQLAVIETDPPSNIKYDPWAVLRLFAKKYNNLLVIGGSIVGFVIILRLIRMWREYLRQRHRWRADHGFVHDEADLAVTPEQKRRLHLHNVMRVVYRYVERTIIVVGIVFGAAFVLNAFVVQIGTVSGMSMWSTLEDGQKIVINRLPVTVSQANRTQYIPKRGAIVVVSPNFGTVSADTADAGDELIIKRVIGLPGERVVADGGTLTVYNEDHPDGFNPDDASSWLENVQQDASTDHIDVTLGENEIFICGDNRPVSIDSRYNGPIATNQILGVVSWH